MRCLSIVSVFPTVDSGQHASSLEKQTEVMAFKWSKATNKNQYSFKCEHILTVIHRDTLYEVQLGLLWLTPYSSKGKLPHSKVKQWENMLTIALKQILILGGPFFFFFRFLEVFLLTLSIVVPSVTKDKYCHPLHKNWTIPSNKSIHLSSDLEINLNKEVSREYKQT